jgi:hypothetical protein
VADRASCAGLQDHRRRPRNSGDVSAVRRFVWQLDFFAEAIVAIDGSRFKAVNTRDKNFTRASIKRRMEQVEASIDRYLSALATADRHDRPWSQRCMRRRISRSR